MKARSISSTRLTFLQSLLSVFSQTTAPTGFSINYFAGPTCVFVPTNA